MSEIAQPLTPATPPFPLKSIGFWMAFLSPVAFAAYLGLPLSDPPNVGFVHVYGLRAFFLGLFALVLILRRDFIALQWCALTAVVMAVATRIWRRAQAVPPPLSADIWPRDCIWRSRR